MQELIDISHAVLKVSDQPVESMARQVAEFALPGDVYNKLNGRFEPSGLSLEPFIDLVLSARANRPQQHRQQRRRLQRSAN